MFIVNFLILLQTVSTYHNYTRRITQDIIVTLVFVGMFDLQVSVCMCCTGSQVDKSLLGLSVMDVSFGVNGPKEAVSTLDDSSAAGDTPGSNRSEYLYL